MAIPGAVQLLTGGVAARLPLGLEQDDRELLAVGRLKPIARDKASGRADPWQDAVHERLGCHAGPVGMDQRPRRCMAHVVKSASASASLGGPCKRFSSMNSGAVGQALTRMRSAARSRS